MHGTKIENLEPSLADAIPAIGRSEALAPATRSQWACALRFVATALDRPPAVVPARWTSIRIPLKRLHYAPLGISAKTLANYKSNAKAALRWFSEAEHVPKQGTPLHPNWKRLQRSIKKMSSRIRLYGLIRYASAKGIAPADVTESVVDAYFTYRGETTFLAIDDAARRALARTWNECVETVEGWPEHRLALPGPKPKSAAPEWEDFAEPLRQDIDKYLQSLMQLRRNQRGRRIRPNKPSSVKTRRAELLAFARKAVEIGTPISELSSLAALLHPDRVERVIDAYWREDGEEPNRYTIDLAWKLHSIASETHCLAEPELQRLDDIRYRLQGYCRGGLTDKNLNVIRQVLAPGVWRTVLLLPEQLMTEAEALREQAPFKAAVKAQMAVAIGILTVAPVRLINLVSILFDENLIRPGGLDGPYWLVFPDHDVKNRVKLEFPFDQRMTSLIERYAHQYRPTLLRGTNSRALFPGLNGTTKSKDEFSRQIVRCVQSATGLRLTVHQYRHAAAAIILQHEPGNYELVRRILGHRSVATTINSYIGLETSEANRQFGKIIEERLFAPTTGSPA